MTGPTTNGPSVLAEEANECTVWDSLASKIAHLAQYCLATSSTDQESIKSEEAASRGKTLDYAIKIRAYALLAALVLIGTDSHF